MGGVTLHSQQRQLKEGETRSVGLNQIDVVEGGRLACISKVLMDVLSLKYLHKPIQQNTL